MLTSRIRCGVIIAMAAVVPVLAAPSANAAMAVAGHVGASREGGVTCLAGATYHSLNRVIVQPPVMSSSPVSAGPVFTVGGGMYGGGYHIQRVGYRAYLFRWTRGAWRYTGVAGALQVGQTADALQPVLWTRNGSTVFTMSGHGYYKIYLRFYWAADSQTAAGVASGWSYQYEQGRLKYCTF